LREHFAAQEAFRLVAISYPPGGMGDDVPLLRQETATLLKRLDLELPTYYDPDQRTLAAVDQLIGFEGFPTSVLLDRQGVVRAVWVGYRSGLEVEIQRLVEKTLSETEGEKHHGDTEIKR
jgi:hypothetical protein